MFHEFDCFQLPGATQKNMSNGNHRAIAPMLFGAVTGPNRNLANKPIGSRTVGLVAPARVLSCATRNLAVVEGLTPAATVTVTAALGIAAAL